MPLRPVDTSETAIVKKKVLYVEDSTSNWEVTKLSLGDTYELHQATNAEQAFQKILANEFDLVLMDIELAGSDYNGIEITKILRGTFSGRQTASVHRVYGKHKKLPIVFVTAYSTRYSKDELISAGGNNAVFKPVDFPMLTLILSNLMMQGVRERLQNLVKKS